MKYVLCYWESGEYHYKKLDANNYDEAMTEATGEMEDYHIDAYMRNEWEVQQ